MGKTRDYRLLWRRAEEVCRRLKEEKKKKKKKSSWVGSQVNGWWREGFAAPGPFSGEKNRSEVGVRVSSEEAPQR
jgi:hypothetical protein